MALGKAVVNITANLGPLKRGLAAAQGMIKKTFTGLASRTLKTLKTSVLRVTQALKRMAKVLAVAVVAGFVASIKVAADFQEQMQKVNTMLDNKSDPILKEFTEDIEIMSRTFGESTAVLSSALFDILSASIDTAKATDLLAVASKTAAGGFTDVATSTSALLSIINSYGMEAEDALDISDKMFASFKRGRFEIGQLASSIGRVAATANTANLNLDELLAIISTVTRGGVKMEEAVTAINSVMTAFLKPQDEAKEVAKSFGLELSSNTLKTIGFVEAIKKLNKATPEQRAAIVPNIRGFKAFARALDDIKGLQIDLTLISEDAAGRTEAAFDKMADTVSFQSKRAKQQVIALGRRIGMPMLDPLQGGLERLNDNFDRLNRLIDKSKGKLGEFGEALFKALPERIGEKFEEFKIDKALFGTREAVDKLMRDAVRGIIESIKRAFEIVKPAIIEIGTFIGNNIVLGIIKAMEAYTPFGGTTGPSFGGTGAFAPLTSQTTGRPKVGDIRN